MSSQQAGRLENSYKPNPARPLKPVPEIVDKIYKQGPEYKQVLKISDEYNVKKPQPDSIATMGEIKNVRDAILRLSLFPNRVNKLGWATNNLGTYAVGGNI